MATPEFSSGFFFHGSIFYMLVNVHVNHNVKRVGKLHDNVSKFGYLKTLGTN